MPSPESVPACTLVTGASSGLGREIAVRLAPNRRLILHGRDAGRLEETRRLCARPAEHLVWPFDLRQPEQIAASLGPFLRNAKTAVEAFVHSAGACKMLPLRDSDPESAQALMRVNFFAAAEIARQLLKKSVNQKQLRSIVFISSTASRFGAKALGLYGASKGALDALMRSMAVELAPEIRVNSVLPGGMRTPMTESLYVDPERAASLEKDVPLGPGRPGDVAAAVEFLLSEQARWITGQELMVDGGRTVNIST